MLQNVIQGVEPFPGFQYFLSYLFALIGRIHSAVPLLVQTITPYTTAPTSFSEMAARLVFARSVLVPALNVVNHR
jgi:hypothetical protein